jgi:hypothetical protein
VAGIKRLGVATVVLMVAAVACDGSTAHTPDLSLRTALAAVGGRWAAPPVGEQTPGAVIAARCGDPRSGSDRASRGAAVSSVRTGVSIASGGVPVPGPDGPFLRVALLHERDDGGASATVASMTARALRSCVVRAANRSLRGRDPREYAPVPPVTARDVHARRARTAVGGNPIVLQAWFADDVLGGFDNTRTITVAAIRRGALVVTVLLATSSQRPSPAADTQWAERAVRDILARA